MASTSPPDEIKQVLVVRADLQMGKGKLAAQASHASLDAFRKAERENAEETREWLHSGTPKVTVKVQGEKELVAVFQEAKDAGLPAALVQDAGRTQLEPGTYTCVGIGPANSKQLDKITGKLKLL